MKEHFKKWMELVQEYKPLTLADIDEESPIYKGGILYRDSLGKTINELPDSSIVITTKSDPHMSADILTEVAVAFTINKVYMIDETA